MIKNNKECTEDRFLSDVKDHKISIVKDGECSMSKQSEAKHDQGY